MIYTLYKATSPTGLSYIGVTKDIKRRMKEHRTSQWPFGVALRELGEDAFKFEFEEFNTRAEAEAREFELVNLVSISEGKLYNLCVGGSPTNQFTLSNPMYDKDVVSKHPNIWTTEHNPIYDPEVKQRMIESQRRKRVSVDGVVYEGVREAGRQLGISRQLVVYRLRAENFSTWYYIS